MALNFESVVINTVDKSINFECLLCLITLVSFDTICWDQITGNTFVEETSLTSGVSTYSHHSIKRTGSIKLPRLKVSSSYFLILSSLQQLASLKSNLKSQINANFQRDSCKILFIVLSLLNDLILIFSKNLY